MKKSIKIILVTFFIILVTVMLFGGRFLIVNDTLKPADAIIVLGGGSDERIIHGVNLFKQQYADTLIISGCGKNVHDHSAMRMKKVAEGLGVPDSCIMMDLLNSADPGTGDQALTLREMLQEHNFKSAIIVTSNYHTGRVKFIFDRAFKETGIDILISHPEESSFNPGRWWKSRANTRLFVFEVIKTVWYWLTFDGKVNTMNVNKK